MDKGLVGLTARRRRLITVLVLLAAAVIAGCQSVPPASSPACSGETWQESKLFFGRNLPTGGEVTESQWTAFLEETIVPRLAEGFTVLDGAGFWLDSDTSKTKGEKSKVLIVLHPDQDVARKALKEIADAYVHQFDQQAVLGASQTICVTFHTGESVVGPNSTIQSSLPQFCGLTSEVPANPHS